jgi:FkbM family methyltransferase
MAIRAKIGDEEVCVAETSNADFWRGCTAGEWEPETPLVLDRFVDPSGSHIDIGAWIGPTVLYGGRIAKTVFAIEPDPLAFSELTENLALNEPRTSNIKAFELCIAPVSGWVSFGSRGAGGDSMSSLLFAKERTSWNVQAITFEEFIEEHRIRDCKFIKMDIEGAEYDVIPTMAAYLEKYRPNLYLSLHPHLISAKVLERLYRTAILMKSLKSYKNVYNPSGRLPRKGKFRSKVRWALDSISFRPVVKAMAYIYAIRKNTTALVFSNENW